VADSYTQFSEMLKVKKEKERAWFRLMLRAGDKTVSDHWLDNEPMTEAAKVWEKILGKENDESAEFHWEIEDEGVWFYADCCGNCEHAAKLVQRFFQDMRPKGNDIFTLTWAGTCSKPRLGQFGGGACVVTKKKIYWMNTWDWVEQQVKKLGKKT
jgi:hypothetical protein